MWCFNCLINSSGPRLPLTSSKIIYSYWASPKLSFFAERVGNITKKTLIPTLGLQWSPQAEPKEVIIKSTFPHTLPLIGLCI
jgi:hypothetical protein